ncbi:hypothetical protein [Streptomyces sp. JJ36]|uniref:hypothetical protein n=1 Tax=Streptomyces sp. JJ36 TaxID=2736645 RepID=UPI001F42A8B5|nr:hypothetical protein [Streptomyces sp. JJ36]MCF6522707.1 hypothetical protein [Streptomyces sp. JJ36]
MKTCARIGVASLIAVLAGCTGSGASDDVPTATPEPSATQQPTAAPSEESAAEPTPSFTQDGSTRVLTYGTVEVRATPEDEGVRTAVTVSNDTDEEATYQLRVSIGDGEDWVAHKSFWFQSVAPGATAEDTALLGGSHRGDDVPERPEIHIDRFERIG